MSIFSHPIVARSTARVMQLGTGLGARRMASSAGSRLPEFTGQAEQLNIPTALGPARARLYRATSSDRPSGVHVNLHGGGFVLDLTDLEDPFCRAIASLADVNVLNVEYAVAPQHPFPAPAHQVHEIASWAARNGAEHGWDGSRLTIGGQSAGGNLAAAAARLSQERDGPAIALQVLHYPPLDISVPYSAKRSVVAKPMLRPWMTEVFDTAYTTDPTERGDRLVSPAGERDTEDLSGIAPALVIAAEHDILRDEARRYADRLDRADALVEYVEIAGADHGYDLKDDAAARRTYARIADAVRKATSS